MTIISNADPKRNPVTSLLGGVFIVISSLMYIVKYIVPAFVILKQEIPFEWYVPLIPLTIGILLVFINDDYFAKIFNRADKVAAKKTDTE
jgi:UDP-N-acetylmuramyl pentapeptide phosphotransferase/UDP-N-acetylglucosamine-1-phosphate transferase